MTPTLFLLAGLGIGLERPDVEFQVFQFPANQIPRIDGDTSDWSIVPNSYPYRLRSPSTVASGRVHTRRMYYAS